MKFEQFKPSRDKEKGKAPGFFAINEVDGLEYLIKVAPKSFWITNSIPYLHELDEHSIIIQFLQEYISAPLLQLLLPNLASGFELLVHTDQAHTFLYGSSKLFVQFTDVHDLESEFINRNSEGFEEAVAASLIAADFDYHGRNLGTIKNPDEEGIDYLIAKVDHGMGATNFYSNELALREDIDDKFVDFDYASIQFNLEKFRNALAQMLSAISGTIIEDYIRTRISNLEQAGFNFANLRICTALNNKTRVTEFKSAQELKEFYIKAFKMHLHTMYNLVGAFTIFQSIDSTHTAQFCNLLIDDPIVTAYGRNFKIQGLTAIEYAFAQGIPICSKHPFAFLSDMNEKFDSKSPIKAHIDEAIEIKVTPLLLEEIVSRYEHLKTDPTRFDYTEAELITYFNKIQAELYPDTVKRYAENSTLVNCLATLDQGDFIKISSGISILSPFPNPKLAVSVETLLSHYDLETLYKLSKMTTFTPAEIVFLNPTCSPLNIFCQYICELMVPNNKLEKTNLTTTFAELIEISSTSEQPALAL